MSYNGRKTIYTSIDDFDLSNEQGILNEINQALVIHFKNRAEEEYLENYRKGIQPILYRTKERNGEICCNKIVENHAEQITAFKNGFFLQNPAPFLARNTDSADKVKELNEYLYRSGKHQADNEVVNWFHTVGVGFLFVEPNDDEEIPFNAYALSPMTADVVCSLRPGNKPVYGFHAVTQGKELFVDVYSRNYYLRLWGSVEPIQTKDEENGCTYVTHILEILPNRLAPYVPIIKYRYNETNMGSFECVLDELDAINTIRSNSVDGIEQFIQSLLVAYNVQFDDDETADSIKKKGMLLLKSVGDNPADVKILAEQLDQTQTEVLVQSILKQAFDICGVPFSQNGTSSDNVGATMFKLGWETADSFAKNTEDEFRKSNRYFEEIIIKILADKGLLDISINDFELSFSRNELANIQAKAQACGTMVGFGLHPILAMEWSGLTNDSLAAYEMSKEFFEKKQKYNSQGTFGVLSGTAYGTNQEVIEEPTNEVVENEITV